VNACHGVLRGVEYFDTKRTEMSQAPIEMGLADQTFSGEEKIF
jgi:hypothetical protein